MTERRLVLRRLEWLAFATALLCLGWVGAVHLQGALFDREQRAAFESQRLDAAPAAGAAADTRAPAKAAPASLASGAVLGILEIPRLGFSEIVAEGDDESILQIAIGHLPDTPLPWQPGNSALAGHRDGRFRPLSKIKVGDRIRLRTHYGDFDYILRETVIVNPSDVWVLKPTDTRTLTLITCYPFNYVGRAPKRFVIKAEAAETAAADLKTRR